MKKYKTTEITPGYSSVSVRMPLELIKRINADLESIPHIPTRAQAITQALVLHWDKFVRAERAKYEALNSEAETP